MAAGRAGPAGASAVPFDAAHLRALVIGSAELQRRETEFQETEAEFAASNRRLKVLGLPDAAIERLARTRSIESVSYLYASSAGTVLERKVAGTLDDAEPMAWIRTLNQRLAHEPLGHVLQAVFDESFLLEMAARSYHGDQTVANLLKLRRLLES